MGWGWGAKGQRRKGSQQVWKEMVERGVTGKGGGTGSGAEGAGGGGRAHRAEDRVFLGYGRGGCDDLRWPFGGWGR